VPASAYGTLFNYVSEAHELCNSYKQFMKAKSLEKEKVLIGYTGENVPESVKNFMPDVYKDGDWFICILGVEPDAVTGEGKSVEDAMKNWDDAHQARNQLHRPA
jgi:L-2-hydroxyglutarate oxidase LhgO